MLALEPTLPTAVRAPMLAGQRLHARREPTFRTTDPVPTLPARFLASMLPGELEPTLHTSARAPILPDQRLHARREPDALRLAFHQPVAAIPPISGWSMGSWESVRLRRSRRRGFPRSHGPSAAEGADQRLRSRQPPRGWRPGGASPGGGRSARPQRRRSAGRPWGKPWRDEPWAAEVAGLVIGPIRSPAGPTGSGEMP